MTTENQVKTLIIKSRGRKYYHCIISGYKAKLAINSISSDLQIDRVVKLEVKDMSKRSKYGTELIFEPVAILTDRDAAALREAAAKKRDAEKWLGYAETDAYRGYDRTKAIKKALEICEGYSDLETRLADLKKEIAKHKKVSTESPRAAKVADRTILVPDSVVRAQYGEVYVRGQKYRLLEPKRSTWIDENDPSLHGSHLLGYEGERATHWTFKNAAN